MTKAKSSSKNKAAAPAAPEQKQQSSLAAKHLSQGKQSAGKKAGARFNKKEKRSVITGSANSETPKAQGLTLKADVNPKAPVGDQTAAILKNHKEAAIEMLTGAGIISQAHDNDGNVDDTMLHDLISGKIRTGHLTING